MDPVILNGVKDLPPKQMRSAAILASPLVRCRDPSPMAQDDPGQTCSLPHTARLAAEGSQKRSKRAGLQALAPLSTVTEEVKFEGGKILSLGFDNYDIPRFSWLPKLDCVILERNDKPPRGGGEPAIVPVGAVIANAIFDATGARLFRTPMTPERVLEALKKV